MKFIRSRGIIIRDGKLAVMKREKNGKKYCVFPGGHLEGDESPEACVVRELMEEFGIVVEPIKMIYGLIEKDSAQAFFTLKWKSGKIHKTDGEEYQPDRKGGSYEPAMVKFEDLVKENLMPPEVRDMLLDDLKKYGEKLDRPYIEIESKE